MATTKAKKQAARRRVAKAKREARLLRDHPLLNPAATLSGTSLRRAARSVTNEEFDPKIAAVRTAGRNAEAQGTGLVNRTDAYYRQLAEGEADRVARQKALGSELDTRLSGINADTNAGLDKADAAAHAAQAADAEVRGSAGPGDKQLLDELAAQRARASTNAQTFRSSAAVETGNYGNLVNAQGGARAAHGAEAHRDLTTRLANQMADARAQETTLKGQKAEAGVKNLVTLRQSSFENAATLRGLGLKEADINASQAKADSEIALAKRRQREVERNNKRNARLAGDRNATTKRGQDLQHGDRQAALDAKTDPKKNKKPESAAAIKIKRDVTNTIGDYRSKHGTKDRKGRLWTLQRIHADMIANGVPRDVANAALDIVALGGLSAPNIAALRRAGVRIPRAWLTGTRHGSGAERPT